MRRNNIPKNRQSPNDELMGSQCAAGSDPVSIEMHHMRHGTDVKKLTEREIRIGTQEGVLLPEKAA